MPEQDLELEADLIHSAPEVGAEEGSADENGGESSTPRTEGEAQAKPEDKAKPKTAFEAVKDLMRKRSDEGASAQQDDGGEAAKDEGEAGSENSERAEDGGEADEPLKAEPVRDPKTASDHRWNRLLKERARLGRELEAIRPLAENFEQMRAFTQSNGLQPQDVTEALEMARLLRTDRKQAFERLSALVSDMGREFGEAPDLPEDLQTKVADGRLDEESARELARARAEAKYAAQRARELQERSVAQVEQQRTQTFIASLVDAAEKYDKWWRSNDPDYDMKAGLVKDRVAAMIASGDHPQSADDVRKQIAKARKEIEAKLASIAPGPRRDPKGDMPASQGRSVDPPPKTAFEAAKAALRKTRAA